MHNRLIFVSASTTEHPARWIEMGFTLFRSRIHVCTRDDTLLYVVDVKELWQRNQRQK